MTLHHVTTANDIKTVEYLASEIWREHYPKIIGEAQVDYMLRTFQDATAITRQIHEGARYYLLYDEARPQGYLSVYLETEQLFLSKLYIKASQRGRGHSRSALAFLETLARQHGLSKITLTVNKENTLALDVYARLGFSDMGPTVQDIGGGFVMDDFKLEKPLEASE